VIFPRIGFAHKPEVLQFAAAYWFRKRVVCGRDLEHAAGRVALSKKRGVCPACESTHREDEIDKLKRAALEADRERFRRSHRC
jgi:hypothetical protein